MGKESPVTYQDRQFLTFCIKGQVFGLDIQHVKEIMEYCAVTPVPLVPEYIMGLLNLRGKAVPVIDLSRRFEQEGTAVTRKTCIIVTEIQYSGLPFDIGLMVDSVNEVARLTKDDIGSAPDFGGGVRADFIRNVGQVAGTFVLLLDVVRLFDFADIVTMRTIALNSGARE